ncbi:hypothetical protein BX600DRAFT_515491 [Xylariales sp. PMI_506]|nr:hypothetical protein BX600DRAFT_515491 [Xylariales sp. PMI_506]
MFIAKRIGIIVLGQCTIGIPAKYQIPPMSVELADNLYFTLLFLYPLTKSWRIKSRSVAQSVVTIRLRRLAMRSFLGSLSSLLLAAANLGVFLGLGMEPVWLCLFLCRLEITYSSVLVYVVTWKDNTELPEPHLNTIPQTTQRPTVRVIHAGDTSLLQPTNHSDEPSISLKGETVEV